ncbi:lysozyme [Acinetobacter pittii]|uniref:lysozyme n=1 Tax=Acinetobacter pittii TaxID=48296 RepID=UPI000710596B|nr:lysozyme [Acinetobacter pittii]KRI46531.1 lysozyme [Acinetobacter pittii]
MKNNPKLWVVGLAASAAFFTHLINYEGFTSSPVIPVKGDKPTIGIGSTKYENGTPVKMTDKPISKERAVQIAKAHISKDEAYFRSSLPGVKLSQVEYDLYLDFMYQFGQSAWSGSSMRRLILQGQPRQACDALLKWKYVAKRDCSIRSNGCYGVWTRQVDRYQKCVGANS